VIGEPLPAIIQAMEARTSVALPLSTSQEDADVRRFEVIIRKRFGSVDAYARRRVPARAHDVTGEERSLSLETRRRPARWLAFWLN
jgi:hypothetical protein